jgi:hypothetical protein
MEKESFMRRILVPVDKSDSSLIGQETAVLIAKETETPIRTLKT